MRIKRIYILIGVLEKLTQLFLVFDPLFKLISVSICRSLIFQLYFTVTAFAIILGTLFG